MTGQISVEVDATPQVDLAAVMAEIREEYEGIVKRNNKHLEEWYNQKVRVDQKPGRFLTELKLLLPSTCM